jgi:hypothetical protein
MKVRIIGLLILVFLVFPGWMEAGYSAGKEPTTKNETHIIAELACQAPPHCSNPLFVFGTPNPVYKEYYGENEEIWAAVAPKNGRNDYTGNYARIYIVYHNPGCKWEDGTKLTDVSGGFETIEIQPGCANGNYTRIWSNPVIREEGYDVVLDFKPFEEYNRGRDIIDGLDNKGFIVPKLWICLESISFNHDPNCQICDALNIRKNFNEEVHIPEWEKGERPYPAAYIRDNYITIKAVFSAAPEVSSAAIIAKTKSGQLGNIDEKVVSFEGGRSKPVYFWASKKTPNMITSFCQEWQWYYQNVNKSGSSSVEIGNSKNKIYVILADPKLPWKSKGQSKPWADALEKSCCWSDGETTQEGAAEKITHHLYNDIGGEYDLGGGEYTCRSGCPFAFDRFLRAIPEVGPVNCADMGKALVTFSNILGCNLNYYDQKIEYNINCIKAIGIDWDWDCNRTFDFHAFAGTDDEKIFDASVKVDTDNAPKSPPHIETWLTDIAKGDYMRKLVKENFTPRSSSQRHFFKFFWASISGNEVTLDEKFSGLGNSKEVGRVISGIDLSDSNLLSFIDGKSVLKSPLCDVEVFGKTLLSTGRQKWKEENGSLDLKIVVGPTSKKIREYLEFRYSNRSSKPEVLERNKAIGDDCIVLKEKQDGLPIRIDLIRRNVLIIMRAVGDVRGKIMEYARTLDGYLNGKLETESVASNENLSEIPVIDLFEICDKSIKLGERSRIELKRNNLENRGMNFFWLVSGGGVEKDCGGDLFFYGAEKGKHTIILIITLNDMFSARSTPKEIEVVSNWQYDISIKEVSSFGVRRVD